MIQSPSIILLIAAFLIIAGVLWWSAERITSPPKKKIILHKDGYELCSICGGGPEYEDHIFKEKNRPVVCHDCSIENTKQPR